MITRSATARTRVDEEEAETGGSEDEGNDAPLTDKARRRRAAALYVVGKDLGVDGVKYRSVLEHVGLPSDKNAQSAVRKAVDAIRRSERRDEIAQADWMHDFAARLGGGCSTAHRTRPSPRTTRAIERRDRREAVSRKLREGGDPDDDARRRKAAGSIRRTPTSFGVRCAPLEKERAARTSMPRMIPRLRLWGQQGRSRG